MQVHTSSYQKNTIVPMSTLGRGQITRSTPPKLPSPRQPLTVNTMGLVCNWQNWQFRPVGRARSSIVLLMSRSIAGNCGFWG
jgi:hypothetical protein